MRVGREGRMELSPGKFGSVGQPCCTAAGHVRASFSSLGARFPVAPEGLVLQACPQFQPLPAGASWVLTAPVTPCRCESCRRDMSPQEELENFPLPTVQRSQTVLNQLRYPSVLLLVCQDSEQSKPDVHFFHCDEVEVRRHRAGQGGAPQRCVPPSWLPDARFPRQSWCTRTSRARWPTAGWARRCGHRP